MKGMKNNKDDQKVFFFCTRREKKQTGEKKDRKHERQLKVNISHGTTGNSNHQTAGNHKRRVSFSTELVIKLSH